MHKSSFIKAAIFALAPVAAITGLAAGASAGTTAAPAAHTVVYKARPKPHTHKVWVPTTYKEVRVVRYEYNNRTHKYQEIVSYRREIKVPGHYITVPGR